MMKYFDLSSVDAVIIASGDGLLFEVSVTYLHTCTLWLSICLLDVENRELEHLILFNVR